MSEGTTENMDGGRSFEERVFLRFDALDASIHNLDERVQVLEARSFDTRPIWERALQKIAETRKELSETRRELSDMRREMAVGFDRLEARINKLAAVILDTRADLHEAQGRIEKLEEQFKQ